MAWEHQSSRRSVLRAGAALAVGWFVADTARKATTDEKGKQTSDFRRIELLARPTRVFKARDRSHENTESWVLSLVVQAGAESKLNPTAMRVELLKGTKVLRISSYSAEGFKPLTYETSSPPPLAAGGVSPVPIFWPFAVRLRYTEPVELGVESMRIEVEATDEKGRRHRGSAVVPIGIYKQRTSLIFPFRGKGIILQAGASNGGHRNRSGQFALDGFGLDDAWSIILPGDGKKNSDYLGWGRPLVAPADGTIVRVRSDRPEQPIADVSDPKYYAPEYPDGGDPGNYLVIDHGGDEYSMIAHFQEGSILVTLGQRVRQGQTLGKLGHTGDTSGPHVHYQLQAGPDWENSDALPCRFTNVDEPVLDRGTYFEAK